MAAFTVQYVGADTAIVVEAEFTAGDQVHAHVVGEQGHGRLCAYVLEQGRLDCATAGVRGVDDSAVAVTALAREMEGLGAVAAGHAGERDPDVHQSANRGRAALDGETHDLLVAQPGAGVEGVGHVRVHGVGFVEDRRDAALRIIGAAFLQRALGQHRHTGVGRQAQGQTETGRAAADYQDVIEFEAFRALGPTHAHSGRGGACDSPRCLR
ncbi:hypothetical protein BMS3Bbin12_01834 [bacterium BMS3Bbin12]|nr:hypothetical protein BMS3Bbin12_01834 [bacterium BMS3Bbin12]